MAPPPWSRPVGRGGTATGDEELGPWGGSLVGPSNGIQLKHGPHRGRLLWCGHFGTYNSTVVWLSDDGGASYSLSSAVFSWMDECTMAAQISMNR